jgi:hypothetical protein
LADHAVLKFRRGPTCSGKMNRSERQGASIDTVA